MTRQIPLSAPWIDGREEELVVETLRSGQLSLGPMIDRFEEALAAFTGAPRVAAVSSGTAGLHLCMRLAGIAPGDEVVTTPYSFVASANCALYEGARPVFADIDPDTLNLDPSAVEAAITPETKAILPVHIFGYPAEMAELEAIAERHGLVIVEDACEALGAEYRGRPIGSSGHPAVFAFYPNKQMTTGEGGAVAVGSEEEWTLLKSLSNQGRSDSGEWLTHARLGYNYRLDDLSAALGLAQVERLDEILAARSEVAARYAGLLAAVDGVEAPLPDDDEHRRSWFVYVVKLARGVDRNGVMARLGEEGIASKPYLPSIHLQPFYRERFGYREGMLPVSEDASARTLALPFHARLPAEDQERVVDALVRVLA
ncbi:MAG TPA: DegT/DnrJ/EryC1/StrS family aminotransferase [Gaiellaceae bacterium]|nr:DegT/DnrJ/EryC1/StrS family aminotransferase [Gaiellaceae bacterium]